MGLRASVAWVHRAGLSDGIARCGLREVLAFASESLSRQSSLRLVGSCVVLSAYIFKGLWTRHAMVRGEPRARARRPPTHTPARRAAGAPAPPRGAGAPDTGVREIVTEPLAKQNRKYALTFNRS